MNWVTGVILTFLVTFGSLFGGQKLAAASPSLLIVTIQTAGQGGAGDELIELANTSTAPIVLDGLRLEYYSAQAANMSKPNRTIKLLGTVGANAKWRLVSTASQQTPSDQKFEATLAAAGGHLKLVGTSELDLVGWGTAPHARLHPALPPATGEQLIRRQVDGHYLNAGDNSADFIINNLTPPTVAKPAAAQASANIQLSELLPDPAAPTKDADGEYIELYNASPRTISLNGYYFVVGNSTIKKKLTNLLIGSGRYLALYPKTTKVTLVNKGGRLRLYGPDNRLLGDVRYNKAPVGAAWARSSGTWHWTSALSPGAANKIIQPMVKTKVKASRKKRSAILGSATDQAAVATETEANPKKPVHTSVVAGVGGLAVLYGAYEYRQDLQTIIRKLRGHRGDRSDTGPEPEGR